ncbi:MAG: efflux RND transporter periplasmic adaptor subunit, partial [Planctomycetes bacterium]|nr:efflux RND transporter periplasmic adaptor subunit [Planctomycetota bacterium]
MPFRRYGQRMSHACHDHSRSARPVQRIGRIAGLLIAAAAVGCFPGCEPGDKQGTQPPSRPPARVTTASAISRDVPIYLERIGRIMALEVVAIVPQVGGKLIAAHVQDGADVRKNDLLFEIDPRPFEAELASAQAGLAQDKALLELASAELTRFESAVAMNAVSKLEYDQRKNAVAIAEAKVEAAKASVQTAKLNLEYTRILSPIDGRAGALLVHPGNVVKENDAPLLMIQRLDPIYAEFTITENDLGTVRELMAAM